MSETCCEFNKALIKQFGLERRKGTTGSYYIIPDESIDVLLVVLKMRFWDWCESIEPERSDFFHDREARNVEDWIVSLANPDSESTNWNTYDAKIIDEEEVKNAT